jgi:hypothetical protein
MALDLAAATVVDKYLQVHFGLAAQLVDVSEKLSLVGSNGFAKRFIVAEDGSKAERKDGGMLKAIGNHAGMIDAGFLVEGLLWIVLADDDCEVTGGI